MSIAEGRSPKLPLVDRTSVITNSILLTRRIWELQRRRQALVGRQEQVRAQMPDWAVEPLRLVGLTNDEIRGRIAELSTAEAELGLNEIDNDLEELDRQIEDLENMLVAMPSDSLDEIEAVIGLTVDRFRDVVVTDPSDVFYDHGDARFLAMLERVQEDLSGLLRRSRTRRRLSSGPPRPDRRSVFRSPPILTRGQDPGSSARRQARQAAPLGAQLSGWRSTRLPPSSMKARRWRPEGQHSWSPCWRICSMSSIVPSSMRSMSRASMSAPSPPR